MTYLRVARGSRDGYILVAVLAVMLLLTGLIAAASLLVRSTLDTARVGDAEAPMSGLTQGGLELTAYQLFIIKADPGAINGRRVKFGSGSIGSQIDDEGGKADLNGSDYKLLAAIFQSAGLDLRTATGLLTYINEMRSSDRSPSASGSPSVNAEAPTGTTPPAQGQPSAKAMPRGFLSVDQLEDFRDLTRPEWRALRPLLTVFNPDGKINVLSASPEMLAAIPGLSSADVQVILARRDQTAKKDIEGLLSTNAAAKPFLKTTFGPAFTVRIEAVSRKGRKKTINAVIAASTSPNEPYYVLDWWE